MQSNKRLLHLLFGLTFLFYSVKCVLYPSIIWEPNNPKFTDGTAGYVEEVTPFSKINVVCPNPTTVTKELFYNPIEKFMFENIWIVDKHSYENCAVNTSRPGNKLLLRCNSPLSLRYYTIVFQMYSATLHGLAFKPGKTYYFISTSDGKINSLSNTRGGHCNSHRMKVAIRVCNFWSPCRRRLTAASGC